AAIYLGRFMRSVLVIDKGNGRSSYPQINENYLGFPDGIASMDLRELGKKQAAKFGTIFIEDDIDNIEKNDELFVVKSLEHQYKSKSLIIATGVTDNFPAIKGIHEYIGKSIFWCITCDGYKTIDKKIVVIGKNNQAASTSLQFLNYTKSLTFITNCDKDQVVVSDEFKKRIERNEIKWICGRVEELKGTDGMIKSVVLEDGTEVEADLIFSMQGAVPNSYLAQKIGMHVDKDGYIKTDLEQRTNIPFAYAAGDVTRNFSHQVATAVHEGSAAAQTANYDLYDPDQKE
ncbi:MAG: NAD(P)/FAD-dependent oxidoreductase, partial [Patescibacteria group bacterium]